MRPATAVAARRLLLVLGGAIAAGLLGERAMHRLWRLEGRPLDGDQDPPA